VILTYVGPFFENVERLRRCFSSPLVTKNELFTSQAAVADSRSQDVDFHNREVFFWMGFSCSTLLCPGKNIGTTCRLKKGDIGRNIHQ
jgi:hypothetical protein